MEIYLDTADIEEVRKLSQVLPIAGVTTNPSIIAKSAQDIETLLPELKAAMGGKGQYLHRSLPVMSIPWLKKHYVLAISRIIP